MDHQEKVSPNRLPEALQFDKVLYDLQLLKFDDSSIGLQRDYGSDAPETTVTRDGIEAPNTIIESGLENAPSEPPILHLTEEPKYLKSENELWKSVERRRRSRQRVCLASALLVFIVLAGLAIGLGLGLTSSPPLSGSTQSNSGSTPSNISSSHPPPAPILMSENSALAAGVLENGDRVLFFQDAQAQLQRATYSGASWSLAENISSILSPSIRPNTSLSLDIVHSSLDMLMLFYVDTESTVNLVTYRNSPNGVTTDEIDRYVINATSNLISRHLCSATFPRTDNQTFDTFLIFQDAQYDAVILQNTFYFSDSHANRSVWVDRTKDFGPCYYPAAVVAPAATDVSATMPMGCALVPAGERYDGTGFFANFYNDNSIVDKRVVEIEYNSSTQQFNCSVSPLYYNYSPTSTDIVRWDLSDFVLSIQPDLSEQGFWVNETVLSTYMTSNALAPSSPNAHLPYSKFATLKSSDGMGPLYLYYQLNQTTFAESYYDSSTAGWTSTEVNLVNRANAS